MVKPKNNAHKSAIVFDTETAPLVRHKDCGAHPETSLVYDFGYVVVDHKGNVIAERSFIVSDVFYGYSDAMNSAYYANKLPLYHAGIISGEWEVASLKAIRDQLIQDCNDFNVTTMWAYNATFDKIALNHTIKVLSNGFAKYFIPYGVKVRDIWRYAMTSGLTTSKKYVKWCYETGHITKSGNPQTSAECVYRYITGNEDFNEDHTALSDSKIELAILKKVQKRKKKMPTKCGNGWKGASDTAKAMGLKD